MRHCKYFRQIVVITVVAVLVLKMIIIVIYVMPTKLIAKVIRINILIIINTFMEKMNGNTKKYNPC